MKTENQEVSDKAVWTYFFIILGIFLIFDIFTSIGKSLFLPLELVTYSAQLMGISFGLFLILRSKKMLNLFYIMLSIAVILNVVIIVLSVSSPSTIPFTTTEPAPQLINRSQFIGTQEQYNQYQTIYNRDVSNLISKGFAKINESGSLVYLPPITVYENILKYGTPKQKTFESFGNLLAMTVEYFVLAIILAFLTTILKPRRTNPILEKNSNDN